MQKTRPLFGYNQDMQFRWLVVCAVALALASPAWAQSSPEDTLHGHFAAILAGEYTDADQYFSSAFKRAFKNQQRAQVDTYYRSRVEQLKFGYEILEVMELADEDHETVRITVDFGDPLPDEPIGITIRLYYYLINQKVDPDSPLAGPDKRAWRIDIFDALSYDTLAEARRRPYLYTKESWDDDESRELKSRQGLFRIQLALSRYYEDKGQFPFRLRGSNNRRDELISGGYIMERYPSNGFNGEPMEAVEFGKKSSGDFAYYSIDADGDGHREGYWLLLHGKSKASFYYSDHDSVYILGSASGTQTDLAEQFTQFWVDRGSEYLVINPVMLLLETPEPTGSWIDPLHASVTADDQVPAAPDTAETASLKPVGGDGAPAVIDTPVDQPGIAVEDVLLDTPEPQIPSVMEILTKAFALKTAQAVMLNAEVLTGGIASTDGATDPPLILPVGKREKLKVFHYGW